MNSQYSSGLKAARSASRSTMRRRATDCTRPAEMPRDVYKRQTFWVLHNYSHNVLLVFLAIALPFGIIYGAAYAIKTEAGQHPKRIGQRRERKLCCVWGFDAFA